MFCFRLAAAVGVAALTLSIGLAERIFALGAAILARCGRARACRIGTFLIRHLILQNHPFRRAVGDLFGAGELSNRSARESRRANSRSALWRR